MRKPIKWIYAIALALPLVTLSACKDDPIDTFTPSIQTHGVARLYMQQKYGVNTRLPITIIGEGFETSDKIIFENAEGEVVETVTINVTENSITVGIPYTLKSGDYIGRLLRANGKRFSLGHTNLYWMLDADVADRDGMTIKGVVSCDARGIASVVVSDGVEVTTTDENGFYWLPSKKEAGQVFISLPAGYATADKSGMPDIWRRLEKPANQIEQHNFALVAAPGDDHVVVLLADPHLANRGSSSSDDMNQFRNKFVPDVNATIAKYQQEGKRVIGVALGDISWDTYWYQNNYKVEDAAKDMARINVPVFECMGNHDNDIKATTDFKASEPWRKSVAPRYYSFNVGKVHYVVLDNIEYLSNGTDKLAENAMIDAVQMEWLRKDLATIIDKNTPIAICMHIPLHGHPGRSESGELLPKIQLQNADEFLAALQGFKKVRLLTGHTHVNYNIPVNENIIEHNIAAVCATWWWTGKYYNTHICRDGSVGGYGVMEWTGTNYNRYFKGMGKDRNYQFRVYDRNNVWFKMADWLPNQDITNASVISNFNYVTQDYAREHKGDEIIIDIFSWEDSWKLEVTENGKVLPWQVTNWFEPLHIANYDLFRVNKNNENLAGSAGKTAATSHLFRVVASSPTSTIHVKVTDCYGNVYQETVTRPKPFSVTMD